MSSKLKIDGRPRFWLGVNYWSRAGGPRMWERFDEQRIRAELAQMRDIGLNVCRSFAFIPSFMPEPGRLHDQVFSRFTSFLELCRDERIYTIPTALVGHMSGENHDFVGQRGRCPYTDPELLDWQRALVRAMGKRSATHAAVVAFLASNEMPLWGGHGTPEAIVSWAEQLRDALQRVAPALPFGLGDGVLNLNGGQNGFDVDALRRTIDFVGPHTYYSDLDPYRQALNAEYRVRSLTNLGLPILLEEFGCSSAQCSERNQALYYREAMHGVLSAGASGALGWCFSDFDLVDDPPYDHHAFELGFGITRADGSEKPVCAEMRALSGLLDRIDYPSLAPPTPRAAIVVPRYFNHDYPFSWQDRDRMLRTLLQCYVMCVKAGIEADLVGEQSDLTHHDLLLAPSTQKLLAPTWRTLLERARAGATVYWSYFAGDYNFQPGPWTHNFSELTGCVHGLRFGCFDLPPARVTLRGSDISLQIDTEVGGPPYPRAYLPITPISDGQTEVFATDEAGAIAITRRRHGAGQVFFCNHPIEYYLSAQANINERDESHTLYRLIAARAGLDPRISRSDPSVQVRLCRDRGGPLLWLLNHSWSARQTAIDSPGGAPLFGTDTALAEGSATIDLAPKQVAVYRLNSLH